MDGGNITNGINGAHEKVELGAVLRLPDDQLEQVRAEIISELNLRKQRENLRAFTNNFSGFIDPAFWHCQGNLLSSFIDLVGKLRVLESEGGFESTSHEQGSIKLAVPGLAEGVTVSRTTDLFSVEEGSSLRERNEIRITLADFSSGIVSVIHRGPEETEIKVGGLDAYSGYWLALDSPVINHKDALQEEGIDTLRRLISAANIPVTDELVLDALQYPFIAALASAFGPVAIGPFEDHLSMLHQYYEQQKGGSWFKSQTRASKLRSVERTEYASAYARLRETPRAALTTFEEAELELEKLDL